MINRGESNDGITVCIDVYRVLEMVHSFIIRSIEPIHNRRGDNLRLPLPTSLEIDLESMSLPWPNTPYRF